MRKAQCLRHHLTPHISRHSKAAEQLHGMLGEVLDQASDTAHTVKRLTNLLSTLEILLKRLSEHKFRPNEGSSLEAIERRVDDCEELILELQHEMVKCTQAPSPGIVSGIVSGFKCGSNRALSDRAESNGRPKPPGSNLQKLDENIDELSSRLSLALQVLQQQDFGSAQDELQDTKALLELMRADQVSPEIRIWLQAPDASINYNESCKKKHPGTGLWFIRGPYFNTWLRTARSFSWIHGFAGCGKSDSSTMLRVLILQFVSQLKHQETTFSRLHPDYRGATPPDHALMDYLRQLVAKFNDVYMVLDALDESPRHKHREDLLQTLEKMRRWREPGLHLLVSRDKQDI
ncbi:hypothetical protein N657DRAFT_678006 [Parathielavia appendiculata]|uniref:Nephrocystin 3-like N-terminal domain-containing protein n=1 Tax=Parathielavia appendiculata TaxID=2587402 RepID=A0AAN6U7E7_9PEZI|nr:hypothetical protein N657DRAFT_678006 [Parathielavia appendiculata]